MNRFRVASALLLLLGIGTSIEAQRPRSSPGKSAPAPAMKAIGTVKEVMEAITVPTSEEVFTAASEPPKTDDGWLTVQRQALALAESGNLLMMAGRAPDTTDWTRFSIAQRDAAVRAMQAARARNADALSSASDALYETCENCHKKYLTDK